MLLACTWVGGGIYGKACKQTARPFMDDSQSILTSWSSSASTFHSVKLSYRSHAKYLFLSCDVNRRSLRGSKGGNAQDKIRAPTGILGWPLSATIAFAAFVLAVACFFFIARSIRDMALSGYCNDEFCDVQLHDNELKFPSLWYMDMNCTLYEQDREPWSRIRARRF